MHFGRRRRGLVHLPLHILAGDAGKGIVINRILPLREAVAQVESQLIALALDKYGTATRAELAAMALRMNANFNG